MKTKIGFLEKVRPTQICVGFAEVKRKKDFLKSLSKAELKAYLISKPIPAVMGPDGYLFLVDHHHFAKALNELGVQKCDFTVIHELNTIREECKFFQVLDLLSLTHPYDEKGLRKSDTDIPKTLKDLKDDPYRSLAGVTRKAGGFKKIKKPYLEFMWADFFRERIPLDLVRNDLDSAVKVALELAKSKEASHLDGYIDPSQPSIKKRPIMV